MPNSTDESSPGQNSEKIDPILDRKADGWIADALGAITDPIIVNPSGWGEDLPDWLKKQIPLDRLIENLVAMQEHRQPRGTDSEACAYLFTESLTRPMPPDWCQVYFFVTRKVMKAFNKDLEFPVDFPGSDPLTEGQQDKLLDLKKWIYEKRVEHRKEKARIARGEKIEPIEQESAKAPNKNQQTKMFDL